MKRISNLTEDQAQAIAAMVVTYRAVRAARITRDREAERATERFGIFVVEVETYAAEEERPTPAVLTV